MTNLACRSYRTPLLLVLALLTGSATPGATQHVLTLADGDRVTGRLREIRDGTWMFAFSGVDLKIGVGRVRALQTEGPIGIRLRDGAVVAATVRAAGDSLALMLPDSTVRYAYPKDFEAVGSARKLDALRRGGLFDRWIATGSLGFSDQHGNSRARGITAGFQVSRKSGRVRGEVGASVTREESEPPGGGDLEPTVSTAQEYASVEWYVSPRLFLTAGTRQEQDRFQDLDLRSTYSVGVGIQAVANKRTELRLTLNGGWRREEFVSGGTTESAVLGIAAAFRQALGPVALEWRVSVDPRADDFADYRLMSRTTVTAQVYRGLGFRVELLEQYNNRPQPGVEANDLLVTTTLTYTLGG